MLLMPNKKKVASLIVNGMKQPDYVQKMGDDKETNPFPKFPDSPDGTEGDDDGMGMESAMDDFVSAFEKKDSKGMAKAFKYAHSIAMNKGDDDEDDAEEDAEGE